MAPPLTLPQITDDLALLPDWESRYGYLIDLARALPPYPEARRDDAHQVKGCTSQVWLDARFDTENRLNLALDSDALLVRGLLAVAYAAFNGRKPAEIAQTDLPAALAPTGLLQNLTPNRRNGFASVISKIKGLSM